MTSYLEAEEPNVQQVAELYTLSAAGITFFLTSANESVEFGGDTYEPAPIKRGEVQKGSRLSIEQLNITLYALTDVVRQYIAFYPSTTTNITVRRVHIDDVTLPSSEIFAGYISNVTFSGSTAQIICASVFGTLKFPVPSIYHQRTCNWNLFSIPCGVSITDPNFHAIIFTDAFPSDIQDPALTPFGDDFFEGGFAELKPDSVDDGIIDGETRLIVKHKGDTITIQFPFIQAVAGISSFIGVYAGCDKNFAECRDKFDAADRFGGFPFIPERNPNKIPPEVVT